MGPLQRQQASTASSTVPKADLISRREPEADQIITQVTIHRDHVREKPNYLHLPGRIGTSTHAIAVGGLHPRVGLHGLIHWLSFPFHSQGIELSGETILSTTQNHTKDGSGLGHRCKWPSTLPQDSHQEIQEYTQQIESREKPGKGESSGCLEANEDQKTSRASSTQHDSEVEPWSQMTGNPVSFSFFFFLTSYLSPSSPCSLWPQFHFHIHQEGTFTSELMT